MFPNFKLSSFEFYLTILQLSGVAKSFHNLLLDFLITLKTCLLQNFRHLSFVLVC